MVVLSPSPGLKGFILAIIPKLVPRVDAYCLLLLHFNFTSFLHKISYVIYVYIKKYNLKLYRQFKTGENHI